MTLGGRRTSPSSLQPETASCGPDLRSRLLEILDVTLLRLRFPKCSGLDPNHKLPFLIVNYLLCYPLLNMLLHQCVTQNIA
jgi:hypothetical protein